jgi:hypothetical protein
MQYGAYRRWKVAETELKDASRSKKKGPNKKSDSFFDTIKNNLGAKPRTSGPKAPPSGKNTKGLGQGFGTRAEPPKNMKPITPKKPV